MSTPTTSAPIPSEELSQRIWYMVLLGLLLALFLVDPMVESLVFGVRLARLLVLGILVGTVAAVCRTRGSVLTALALGLPAIIALYLSDGGSPADRVVANALAFSFFLLVMVRLVRQVFSHDVVTAGTVCGALCVYLMFGVSYALVYDLLDVLEPGALQGLVSAHEVAGDLAREEARMDDLLYFSFVTLTTLGYGDVSPVTQAGKACASLEAVVGQLYMAVVVARLVGVQVSAAALRRLPRSGEISPDSLSGAGEGRGLSG